MKILKLRFVPTLFVIGWMIGLQSCGNESEKTATPPPPIQTFVFLDKSTSLNNESDYATQKYAGVLKSIVNTNIRHKSDRLDLYYVHENTAKAHAFTGISKAAIAEDTVSASPTDREALRNDFELVLRKEKSDFLNQSLGHLMKQNTTETNQSTDIWASLEVLSKTADTAAVIHVYYLSDMVESVKGSDRRDFHTTPPQSREQAGEWAKKDAELLKKQINPEIIKKINTHFVLPFAPTSSTRENNPNITYYWEQLFSLLGVEKPVEEVN
jgi:hypothetical protein